MRMIFWLVYFAWFVSEVWLGRMRRSDSTDHKREDKNSLLIIWLVIAFAMPAASIVSTVFPARIADIYWIGYFGLALIITGMALRFMVIRSLGRFFTVDVAIREGHQLKQDGFYALVRHPSYFASWLSFVGFGVSLNNWISLAIVSTLVLGAFLYRIHIEEKVLTGQFGDAYLRYKKTTKAIIPFMW